MNNSSDKKPKRYSGEFTCPHCRVFAQQSWVDSRSVKDRFGLMTTQEFLDYRKNIGSYDQGIVENFIRHLLERMQSIHVSKVPQSLSIAICKSCNEFTIWVGNDLVFPRKSTVAPPNEDLSSEIKGLYEEAQLIFPDSARASAALLRLCVENLCRELGLSGTLNKCIKELVRRGVSERVQQAADYCRVIGNESVHPGQIDFGDEAETVEYLFHLVNDIADEMLTKPRKLKEKYSSLPSEKLRQIEKRDG